MKKITAVCSFLLCLCLLLGFTACADKENTPPVPSVSDPQTPASTEKEPAGEQPQPEKEPEPEKPRDKFTYFDMELDEKRFVEMDKQQVLSAFGEPVSSEVIEDPLFGNYEVLSYNFGKIDLQNTVIRVKVNALEVKGPRQSHVGNTVDEVIALFRNENPDALLSENEYDGSKYMLLYGTYGGAEEFGVVLYDENNKVKEIRYASGIYALVYGVSGGRVDSIEMFVSLV